MSRYEFKLPDIGEGVAEGEIVEWHVKAGDEVKEDQPLVEVMTDKATVTITSPKTGRIVETRGNAGQVVKVHSVLVVYDLGGGAAAVAPPASAMPAVSAGSTGSAFSQAAAPGAAAGAKGKKDEGPAATAVGDIKDVLPGMGAMIATAAPGGVAARPAQGKVPVSDPSALTVEAFRPAPAPPATSSNGNGNGAGGAAHVEDYNAPDGKPLATPATRKLARDLGVNLAKVKPSDPSGRVTKEDVRDHVARAGALVAQPPAGGTAPRPPTPPPSSAAQGSAAAAPLDDVLAKLKRDEPPHAERGPLSVPGSVTRGAAGPEERVPFRGLRRRIAEKMQTSKNTAAHFTFVEEVDCTGLKALRERLKPKAEKAGVKLSYLPFITKAVVAALKKHPILNSSLDTASDELVYRKFYNIGIATATEAGLTVPVVKNADGRSLLDIAREVERLSTAARAGKLALEDLQGGTFTITSLGAQGGLFATPIINFPEVAILGVHQMKQKPVVRDGQIVVGEVMLLSLSFDHRIIDGHVGAAFAYEIIGYLEDPDRLMLEL